MGSTIAPATGVAVAVGVALTDALGALLAVAVGVAVGVAVAVAVGLGTGVPMPSPVMLTLSDLLLAPLTIVSFADFLPSDDAVKTIDTAQLPSAARLPTQLPEGTNSGPCGSIELISIAIEFGL